MYSTPSNRPKRRPVSNPTRYSPEPASSSPSSISSLLVQPPPDLFPSGSDFLKLAVVVAVAIAVAAGCNYLAAFYNRQPNPFCDSDSEFDDLFLDSCEPCPSNGHCYEGKLECNPGYKKYGKKCVEDTHIDMALNKLLERVENQLCSAYVNAICDGIGTIWVPEDELRDTLDGFAWEKNSRLDNMAFEYVKERAMKKIDEDFETRLNNKGTKEYKCPVSLAENYKPIFCCIQQWIAKHSLKLMSVCALLGGCTILLLRVRRRLYLSRRAVEIYDQVCDVLEENALMSRSTTGGETWVVASRLRDHVLSPLERKDHHLWKKVEELMTEDSRMECYPKLVKGESKVVWEWQVEGSLSSSRKKKKSELNHQNSSADVKTSDRKEKSSFFGGKMLFK